MERLTRRDSAEFLEDEEDIAGHPQPAKETGVAREKTYDLFSPDAKPSKATIAKVTKLVSAPLAAAVGG